MVAIANNTHTHIQTQTHIPPPSPPPPPYPDTHTHTCIYIYLQSNLTERRPPNKDPLQTKTAQNSPQEKLLYIYPPPPPPPNRDPQSTKTRDRLFSSQGPHFLFEQRPLQETYILKSVRGLKGFIPHTGAGVGYDCYLTQVMRGPV